MLLRSIVTEGTSMTFEMRQASLASLFPDDAQLTPIAGDFIFTEGPIWDPTNQSLIFSDIAASKQYRWDATHGLSIFRQPSNQANGNFFDRAGRGIPCEHGIGRAAGGGRG